MNTGAGQEAAPQGREQKAERLSCRSPPPPSWPRPGEWGVVVGIPEELCFDGGLSQIEGRVWGKGLSMPVCVFKKPHPFNLAKTLLLLPSAAAWVPRLDCYFLPTSRMVWAAGECKVLDAQPGSDAACPPGDPLRLPAALPSWRKTPRLELTSSRVVPERKQAEDR